MIYIRRREVLLQIQGPMIIQKIRAWNLIDRLIKAIWRLTPNFEAI